MSGDVVLNGWAVLLILGLGIAMGAAGVYLQLHGEAERLVIRERAKRNVGVPRRPMGPPRSNVRLIRPEETD